MHIQVLLRTDTMRFHLGRDVDGVAKQTVAWHLAADHSGYDRSYGVITVQHALRCYLQSIEMF